MNYGGDAADQIVRYSMEGMEHTLRISGSIAKNLAVLIVAVMKDQKKTRGKTNLLRMLKEQRAMKFFTIPHDRLREFAGEAKSRGLLYVVIRDKKNPQFPEIMAFADIAAHSLESGKSGIGIHMIASYEFVYIGLRITVERQDDAWLCLSCELCLHEDFSVRAG